MENSFRRAVTFTMLAAGCSGLVGLVGGGLAPPESARAIWVGVGIALVIQVVLFVALFIGAFAKQPMLAHGLGMLGRLVAVGVVALFWVPMAGVTAAPLLFSLVAVLFLTTLVEPLLISFSVHR